MTQSKSLNTNLNSGFNALFMNDFPMEPYQVKHGDDILEFQRIEHTCKSVPSSVREFSTFSQAIERNSNWGYGPIDFMLKKNGKLVSHYALDPEKIVLPILMKSFHQEDIQIKNSQFIFRDSIAKMFISEIENMIKSSIVDEFSKQV